MTITFLLISALVSICISAKSAEACGFQQVAAQGTAQYTGNTTRLFRAAFTGHMYPPVATFIAMTMTSA